MNAVRTITNKEAQMRRLLIFRYTVKNWSEMSKNDVVTGTETLKLHVRQSLEIEEDGKFIVLKIQ